MKPSRFSYHCPASADEAVALLAQHGEDAKVIAGGQSLVPLLNLRLATPSHLIDVLRVGELDGVARADGWVAVGAGVRQADAEDDPALMRDVPLLAAALPFVAHREIRNAGTVCGSVAHGDPAAEIPLIARALDARMVVRSPRGEREVTAERFFVSALETALEPDELLAAVRFPVAQPGTGVGFHELARRAGDYAIAGAAAQVVVRDGRIVQAHVACLAVDAVPQRIGPAEQVLAGAPADGAPIAEAARAGAATLDPHGDVHASAALRRRAAETLMRRAIADAIADAAEPATEEAPR